MLSPFYETKEVWTDLLSNKEKLYIHLPPKKCSYAYLPGKKKRKACKFDRFKETYNFTGLSSVEKIEEKK